MAGGTGGHVIPALAVASKLSSEGVTINWIGTERGLEADLVRKGVLISTRLRLKGFGVAA